MTPSIGTPAPGFTLPDQNGDPVALADLAGSKALLVFIPFHFTSICDGEVCAIREDIADLHDLDARAIVITLSAVAAGQRSSFRAAISRRSWSVSAGRQATPLRITC